ncbi:MAG: Lrp/AsnC family transcriptional regulator [Candidatus Thorarchaeota archaeon]|jgi:DNA-binding Lrp family transcriptional regulator
MGTAEKIDARDRKIIAILTRNARSSLREIAKEVNLSPSSVRNRMARLLDNGFIERYTVDIDYRKLGFEIQVIVLITSKPGSSEGIYKALKEFQQITRIFWTSGPANFICIVRVRDMAELSQFMTSSLERLEGVERVESMFLMPNP